MLDSKTVAKLSELAELAEDLSAELHSPDNKVVADKFKMIASYSRKIATCVRLHGAVPVERENKLKQGIKTFQQAAAAFKSAGELMEKKS